jgi:hypothetical protein
VSGPRHLLVALAALVACGHPAPAPRHDPPAPVAVPPPQRCVDGWCRENPALGITVTVRGTARNDVWSLESTGVVHHFDGTSWQQFDLALRPPQAAYSLSVLGSRSAMFVGAPGGGQRYDGIAWQPFGIAGYAVWAHSENDVWVARNGHPFCELHHWDGVRWTKDPFHGMVAGTIIAIWGTASDDVWAINNGGTILHYDGAQWTIAVDDLYVGRQPLISGQIRPGNPQLASIWGTSRRDVWVVGRFDGGSFMRPIVLHWDGAAWSEVAFAENEQLSAVWAAAPDDAWAATRDTDRLYHWDGKEWRLHSTHPQSYIRSMWGSGPRDVWAAGVSLLHWNGSSWTDRNLTTGALAAAWFASAGDGWAVGRAGAILHWDGHAWSRAQSGTTNHLVSVWGAGARDVWAVGADATVLHYDGATWVAVPGAEGNLQRVVGSGANDVWLSSQDHSWHWDGHRLDARPAPEWITASPSGELWGFSATSLVRWDGASWQPQGELFSDGESGWPLLAIAPAGDTVWGIGMNVLHWEAGKLSTPELPPPARGFFGPEHYELTSIWARSADDVWVAGGTQVLHWDGHSWRRFHLPGPRLQAIAGSGHDVWAVGDFGVIYHLRGGSPGEPRP